MHGHVDYPGLASFTATGYVFEVLFPSKTILLSGQIALKDKPLGSRFSSTIELRIQNSSLESIIGVGGVNLAEIRQVYKSCFLLYRDCNFQASSNVPIGFLMNARLILDFWCKTKDT